MIINLNKLIEMCVELTDGTIPIKELMEDYHLRFMENGLTVPINEVSINKGRKAIEMKFNENKILDGMDGDE